MTPRASSVAVVLLSLVGCRGGGGAVESPTPSPAAESEVAAPSEPRKSDDSDESTGPSRQAAPESAEPTPEPSDDDASASAPAEPEDGESVQVAGRTVVARIVQVPPTPEAVAADEYAEPTLTLEVVIDGATAKPPGRLSLPTGFTPCDVDEAVVEPVRGPPSPLVFAQAFCESGEDEFSRELLAAVIHVGDTSTAPRVLWQGPGHYFNSFGVCEDIDVPSAAVVRPGLVRIEQTTEVVKNPDPDEIRPPCRPRKHRVKKKAELEF